MKAAARTTQKQRATVPGLSEYHDVVRAVGGKYGYDAAHAAQVAALALQIFAETPEIHGLGPEWATVLEHAALLHDIGYFIHARGHHRHSRHLIRYDALLADYPQPWREMVALVARNHRKRPRKAPRDWDQARAAAAASLASILRIADGLDYGHDAAARLGPLRLRRGGLEVAVSGVRLSTLHAVLVDKARMFTHTFALPVTFVNAERAASRSRSGQPPRPDGRPRRAPKKDARPPAEG